MTYPLCGSIDVLDSRRVPNVSSAVIHMCSTGAVVYWLPEVLNVKHNY
jgi:hypothetical protein